MRKKKDSGLIKWLLIGLTVFFLTVMLVLPLIYVLITALREGWEVYLEALTNEDALASVRLTVTATVISVLINTVFGLFAGGLLTKFSFHGKKVLSALIDLPLTISPVIVGLIYLLTYGRQSVLYDWLQKFGIKVIFSVPGVVMVTVFVTFPFISREIIPVLNAQGKDEEEAAALMGANGFQIFTRITLPHIKWALLYGIVLCAARSMGEFGAVSVISGHLRGKTNTMPLHIELLYQGYDFTGAFAMSSLLVIMAVLILVLRNILEYRGKNAGRKGM